MKIALSTLIDFKPKQGDSETHKSLSASFKNLDLTQQELAEELGLGHVITSWHKNHWRAEKNFLCAQHLGLDYDEIEDPQDILEDPFIEQYHAIWHHTASSTPEKPRIRVFFELEQPIYDPVYYRDIVLSFIWKFGAGLDSSCKDPCRQFYGAKGSNPFFTGKVLPMRSVVEILAEWRKHQEVEARKKEHELRLAQRPALVSNGNGNGHSLSFATEEEIDEAGRTANGFIKNLGKWNGYHEWRSAAVWANSLDRAFNSGSYFFDMFLEESRAHKDYHPEDEKMMAGFKRLQSVRQSFEGLGLIYDPKTKQAIEQGKATYIVWKGKGNGTGNGTETALETLDEVETEEEEEYGDEKEEGGEQKAGKTSQAKLDRELVKFDPNDEGNAQAFIHLHGEKFLYCKAYGWLFYNDRFWKMDNAEFKLHDMVVKTLERRRVAAVRTREETVVKVTNASATNTRNCISMVQPKLATDVETFDADPNLLNCQNGIVDLRTGELVAHDPSQRFTYCIKVPYDQQADYSEWITFLNEVVGGGDEIIDYLQLAMGYSFTGYTREECLFYLFGPTRSGKGTFTETLFTLLGLPMSIEADFNTFTAKRDQDASNFDLAPLKPARLVFASESNRYQTLNPAKIKQLTGGNWIRCSFKHKDFFAYRPQFKVWLSSNWEVNADVDDDAMWGRVKVIKFPNSYLGREDKDLKHRLISPENLTGILRWAIEGAIRWYSLPHGLQTPKLVQDTTAEHRQLADYVQSWLNEYTEKDETYWEPNTAVMSSYLRWCKENNIEPKAAKGLATTLRTKGYLPSVQNKLNGINTRGVQGLKVLVSGNSS